MAGKNHVTVAVAVDDLGMHGFHGTDDFAGGHIRCQPVLLRESEMPNGSFAGGSNLPLIEGMHFQHAKGAFHHLGGWLHFGGFQGHVRHLVDGDAGRDFDVYAGLFLEGREAPGAKTHEGRELRLKGINKDVGPEGHLAVAHVSTPFLRHR